MKRYAKKDTLDGSSSHYIFNYLLQSNTRSHFSRLRATPTHPSCIERHYNSNKRHTTVNIFHKYAFYFVGVRNNSHSGSISTLAYLRRVHGSTSSITPQRYHDKPLQWSVHVSSIQATICIISGQTYHNWRVNK